MTPRDYFGLVVRTVGLLLLTLSIYQMAPFFLFLKLFGNFDHDMMVTPLLNSVVNILLGLYFLRGAPLVVRFSYPRPPAPKGEEKPVDW